MIEIKGPFPKLPYTANMKKEIGMMCGGTGITPMLQVQSGMITFYSTRYSVKRWKERNRERERESEKRYIDGKR